MGATTFSTAAYGKTPAEAFAAAHDHALYMYGHGGYTGTIAEKGSYVLFAVPARVTVSKLLGWIHELSYNEVDYLERDVQDCRRYVANAQPGAVRDAKARLKTAEAALVKGKRERARIEKQIGAHLDLVKRIIPVYNDKWGSAVALEVTGAAEKAQYGSYAAGTKQRGSRLYVFCGYASC